MWLWGRLNSINVQKVAWALGEVGAPFERVEAGGQHGVVDTPEFRGMNPNGRVPVLQDGDLVLWESNAILRHLGRTRGRLGLWPLEEMAVHECDRWMDWQLAHLEPPMRRAFWAKVRPPNPVIDEPAVTAALAEAAALWAVLDSHLGCTGFVAGDAFTLADIPLACFWSRYVRLGGDVVELSSCLRWADHVLSRPAAGFLNTPLS